eukprot:640059-Amphidinium_carterae.1
MPCIRKIEDRWIPMHQTPRASTYVGIRDVQVQGFGFVNARHAPIMHVVRTVSPSFSLMVPSQQSGVPDIGDQ